MGFNPIQPNIRPRNPFSLSLSLCLSLIRAHTDLPPASATPSPLPGRRNPSRRRRLWFFSRGAVRASRAAGMSSNRKNFRRRADDGEEANGDGASLPKPTTATKTQTLTVPKSKSPPRRQGASRLSFADEEDEDDAEEGPFAQRRRPTASVRPARTASPAAASLHRLRPARERVRSTPVAAVAAVSAPKPSNFQSHAGEYTPERLRELQKNARPLPGSLMRAPPPTLATEPRSQSLAGAPASSTPATTTTAAATEPVVILKGLVKPMAEASIGPSKPLQKDAESEEEEEGPVIPDRATIEAIRAKRQQLQQPRHAAPDYISLDGGGVLSSRDAGGESSDEEDNETRGRIAMYTDKSSDGLRSTKGVFGGISSKGPAASLGALNDGIMEAEDDRDDDDDEEERKWEEEQFRKGLGRRVDDASTQRSANGAPATAQVQPQPFGYSVGSHYQPSLSGAVPAASVFASGSAELLSIAQQADVANKALQENIRKLRETHKTTASALVKTDTHLSEALSEISSLESGLQDAEKKFVYMQELRNYISVMCDFLNDKAFYIEELEEHMQKLHESRALAISERREADLADESGVIEAAVNAAISILSKGSSSAYLSAASNAAQAAAAAARERSNLPPELDEFGRDINLQKRMDHKRREENRNRKKAQSESKRLASAGKNDNIEQIEGELSTDESDSESTAYVSSRDELLKAADLVFSDAAEEYSSLRIVKDKFEGWKTQYPSAYRDAHVALSAPSVFTPYVRLELLKWDPLHEETDFLDMEWNKVLFNYGVQDNESAGDPSDADLNLIPVLVENVALPILHHRIKHCWDILSTQRTKNAVDAIIMVIDYLPTSSKGLHQLLATVNSRLTESIANLSVPAWGSMVTRTVPGAAQYAAYRFGVATRLLKNVCLWKGILAKSVFEKLALDELLRGKILPHMKSIILDVHDATTRAERIAAALSGVSSQSQKLQPFVDLVVELGNKLERRHTSGISEEETRGLARRLRNILVALNEYDKARAISKTFQLREAL
ncbi:transcriptional repressor ILP1-like [Phragmites australis]|uniref:transcriptional repressor ILP1-like n=1 Tax=Phragmites australis TaxID=29695 RepID=UPI002D770E83|nr:transcriptional repressor ILP1-like [Phragmites australis]